MESILAKALGQDVSQLAAVEKQLLLSRLLARLAHEIRNPLSSLDIHVQLLEEDVLQLAPQTPTPDKISERFEIIHGELHRLENIVKQFLRLAGPSSLELEPVDARKLVRQICDLLRPEADSRDIVLDSTMPAEVPLIRGDPGQLTQALMNLVVNAIQAVGRRGEVTLFIELPAGEKVLVAGVRDTGPGIPSDRLATIFEPYFTTKEEGSGLGLWIAQQITVAHGGELHGTNSPAGGAVFFLKLPLIPPE